MQELIWTRYLINRSCIQERLTIRIQGPPDADPAFVHCTLPVDAAAPVLPPGGLDPVLAPPAPAPLAGGRGGGAPGGLAATAALVPPAETPLAPGAAMEGGGGVALRARFPACRQAQHSRQGRGSISVSY
jgi:hypothetical protein